MATSKPVVNIDVVCDLTCPYCWVGKRRLMTCIEKLEDKAAFRLQSTPYLLRPDIPPEGMPIPSDYQKPEVLDKLREMGESVGVKMTFKYTRWPNTARCHAMLDLIGQKGGGAKQEEVAEMIHKTHFTDGIFLSDDVVIGIGVKAGYDAEEIRTVITNRDNIDAVHRGSQENKARVSGMIPVYFFNGEEMVVGAQIEETSIIIIITIIITIIIITTTTIIIIIIVIITITITTIITIIITIIIITTIITIILIIIIIIITTIITIIITTTITIIIIIIIIIILITITTTITTTTTTTIITTIIITITIIIIIIVIIVVVVAVIPVYFFNGEEMVVGTQSEETFIIIITIIITIIIIIIITIMMIIIIIIIIIIVVIVAVIPVYYFNGEEMVVGAQSEETFMEKLTLAVERASDEANIANNA
ncbi:hypothetical protein ACOMHN_049856 [Nucella lapillus]